MTALIRRAWNDVDFLEGVIIGVCIAMVIAGIVWMPS